MHSLMLGESNGRMKMEISRKLDNDEALLHLTFMPNDVV